MHMHAFSVGRPATPPSLPISCNQPAGFQFYQEEADLGVTVAAPDHIHMHAQRRTVQTNQTFGHPRHRTRLCCGKTKRSSASPYEQQLRFKTHPAPSCLHQKLIPLVWVVGGGRDGEVEFRSTPSRNRLLRL